MNKKYTLVLLCILYIISYISINYHVNLLYPYYWVKDLLMYPVKAITVDLELKVSNEFQNSVITSLKEEIIELKKLTNINNVLSEFNYINATVILRNREYWFNNLTINKGQKDGLKVDMAVISSDGLIGRISNVRDNTSDVKLLTTNDVESKISVVIKNKDNNIYGVTSGYDSKLNLLNVIINDKKKVEENSKVETTGMGGIFPRGILIGRVVSFIDDNAGMIVKVKLQSNLEEEKYVSILQRKDNI